MHIYSEVETIGTYSRAYVSIEGFLNFAYDIRGAGKARFNVATPTNATVTCTVQHTYYRIIFKQNPFNIISRGVQGCTSTDFRLK